MLIECREHWPSQQQGNHSQQSIMASKTLRLQQKLLLKPNNRLRIFIMMEKGTSMMLSFTEILYLLNSQA